MLIDNFSIADTFFGKLNIVMAVVWMYMIAVAFLIGAFLCLELYKRVRYYTGAYYRYTRRPYWALSRRDGSKCEYLTYERLRHLEREGWRFMFELYLPKGNGETTEIDMIAIGRQAVIAIECKDYTGTILGEEDVSTWIQEKPNAPTFEEKFRKFYNPIMQNDGHMKYLRKYVPIPVWLKSMIVFDNTSKLELGILTRKDVTVVNRRNARIGMRRLTVNLSNTPMTKQDQMEIEKRLKPFTMVGKNVKMQHIANVQRIAAQKGR